MNFLSFVILSSPPSQSLPFFYNFNTFWHERLHKSLLWQSSTRARSERVVCVWSDGKRSAWNCSPYRPRHPILLLLAVRKAREEGNLLQSIRVGGKDEWLPSRLSTFRRQIYDLLSCPGNPSAKLSINTIIQFDARGEDEKCETISWT